MKQETSQLKDYLQQIVEVNGKYSWHQLSNEEQKECVVLGIQEDIYDDYEMWLEEVSIQNIVAKLYLGINSKAQMVNELIDRFEEHFSAVINNILLDLYIQAYGVHPLDGFVKKEPFLNDPAYDAIYGDHLALAKTSNSFNYEDIYN